MIGAPRRRVKSMPDSKGIIAWMVHNRVTPNLLMIVLLLGGFLVSTTIKQEVFPEFELDLITVNVAYPGASPEEVEQSVVLALEQAVQGIEGVDEITATASEGGGSLRAELREDASGQKVLADIEQAVDRIETFPVDAEDPSVTLVSRKRQVLRLNLYGNVSERELRRVAEQVRDQLLLDKGISQVELSGVRDYELTVEIPMETLRRYNLTLDQVARILREKSVDVAGGKIETAGGEILLRVMNRKSWADEFSRIPVILNSDGSTLYLEDIGVVKEGFEDSNRLNTYDKQRSILLKVYRIGKETPIGVSMAARAAMTEIAHTLPPAVSYSFSSDSSKIYKQRLELLLKNAFLGLLLVLLVLGSFLELRLAFWVTMGIPISFLGGLLWLPIFDVSINMISMFAFIISLGIVVDDAIIAGENIYEYRQRGHNRVEAAIRGARDVAMPISFSILTNVAAFLPLYFVPGVMGKVWRVIPLVVITVFLISWLESLLILPAHLAHSKESNGNLLVRIANKWQRFFSSILNWYVRRIYEPSLGWFLRYRFITVACLIAVLLGTAGYVFSGRIAMILMPRVESDRAVVTAVLPIGSPVSEMIRVRDQLAAGIENVAEDNGGDELLEGITSSISNNSVQINAYLTPPDVRQFSTRDVTKMWRQEVGPMVGLQSLRYESDRGGPGSGAGLSIELSHRDIEVLDQASLSLAEQLEFYSGVKDVDSGYAAGKTQYDFVVNERGESLGLTATEVGRQVRSAFQGAIALRQQRGSNEVTVRVRLPEEQRLSEYDIENFMVATPGQTFVPLSDIATINKGRGYTSIKRRDSKRTAMVTANVDPIGATSTIMAGLNADVLPQLARQYPGLSYDYKGRQASRKESVSDLLKNFLFALGGIYFLLAIPFRSYLQPLIVMAAIPFGIIGSVFGHLIMGYNLSLMSLMGIVALSGIVINDSLVLIDYANKQRLKGLSSTVAVSAAGVRRFRPVVLTTFTTFCGLAPMIFESSRQARFMIPMAISLGFGIAFATVITLVLMPCLYLMMEDLRGLLGREERISEPLVQTE
ncbi:MAG: efflux RND transporter permease subunit [Desulfofustis sp.]|nr:efflux RND transporter permease subunit [Desulfofustis sp.]